MRAGVPPALLLGLSCVVVALGCSLTGPKTLELGRPLYNVAVQRTNDEQLLVNLVRLRYRDTPLFLTVASVSTNFDLEGDVSLGATLTRGVNTVNPVNLGFGGRIQESPTVTYTPLVGEQFVKQLLSPIDLSTILLLYHSGWGLDRVLRVSAQQLNGLHNAPSASGPTPILEPEYREFRECAALLRSLQQRGWIDLGQTRDGDELRIRVRPEGLETPEWSRAAELLGVAPKLGDYRVTRDLGARGRGVIRVVTRSVMADLFYVSHGVVAPEEDAEGGRVTTTRTADGEIFDWSSLSGDLLRIHSSGRRPKGAAVRTRYRDSWFYIDDSDLSSKSTFSLLMQLLQLQAGEIPSTAPLLTLPVSR